jgi:hypothetical protein
VRLAVVLCISAPELAVNVSVHVPWLTFLGASKLIFAVVVPGSVTELGLKVQVEFGGPPLHVSETVPVNPKSGVNVNVYVAV